MKKFDLKRKFIVLIFSFLLIFCVNLLFGEVHAVSSTETSSRETNIFVNVVDFFKSLTNKVFKTNTSEQENDDSSSTQSTDKKIYYKVGNINKDKEIDLNDLLKLRRYIAMDKTKTHTTDWNLTEEEQKYADVNADGKIELQDILKLRRYIAAQKSESIAKNHPDWLKLLSLQEYQAQPYDEYRLAAMMHHEFCAASPYVANAKVRDESGKWVLASERDKQEKNGGLRDISRTVGYVLINNVLLKNSNTIEEFFNNYLEAYDSMSDTYNSATEDTPDRYCETCLANARHCLKYDCSSVVSSEGVPMTRNCITQAPYDIGCTSAWAQPNSLIRWWLVDADGEGKVRDDCYYSGFGAMDLFFLRDISNKDYEKDALPVIAYDENDLVTH